MKKLIKFLAGVGFGTFLLGFVVSGLEKKKEKKDAETTDAAAGGSISQKDRKAGRHRAYGFGFYQIYLKRPFDFTIALLGLVFLWPLYLILAVFVRIKLGSPVLFTQERLGKDEKIFKLYKFRTMTDKRDESGELLPDEERLTEFGKKLRASSLDELPELINIVKGDMAVIGPRPLLVKYLPWYTEEQRKRHSVRPGLTGYAQAHGRNAVSWDDKLSMDVEYAERITFRNDFQIILDTIKVVFKHEGINSATAATMEGFDNYCRSMGRRPRG